MVERKCAEVVGLAGADFNLDQGRFRVFVMQDSITGAEERFGIKSLWDFEWFIADS